MWSVDDASRVADAFLGDQLPLRLEHVRATGARSSALAHLPVDLRRLLATAGVLHDLGYSSELVEVGFHPIDGARFLRSDGWDASIVNLVAHHSCAVVEAERRGLLDELNGEFPKDPSLPHERPCLVVSPWPKYSINGWQRSSPGSHSQR